MEDNTIHLFDENDLHKKVVEFIKRFAEDAIIIPGLGEFQFTSLIRSNCYEKGYIGGQPDLLIINSHRYYQGLALEFNSKWQRKTVSPSETVFGQVRTSWI